LRGRAAKIDGRSRKLVERGWSANEEAKKAGRAKGRGFFLEAAKSLRMEFVVLISRSIILEVIGV
jgi:hypothetical protein